MKDPNVNILHFVLYDQNRRGYYVELFNSVGKNVATLPRRGVYRSYWSASRHGRKLADAMNAAPSAC